ncbi:MAG TPA: LacI family DNA-binding transcriptional regulator [Candidatus Merdenecus merdavium]|nr:LacI family DNA-binding transcriptional regulator [Candidatus Merdenecus merdavium]
MKVSIQKISEATGFSPATVSNALNYKKGVNKDTAALIFKTAKELGYIEENRITKVKFVIYKRNGKIVDDTPFFPLLIEGVEKECRAKGYELVMCNLDQRDDDYEQQVKWMLSDTSAGVILLGTELMEEDLELYRGAKCPFLILDYWSNDMSFNGVLINNSDSARLATEYLIGKGHKNIGYLKGNFRIKGFRSRAVGYKIAMDKAGLPICEEQTVTLDTTMDGAYKDMMRYLETAKDLPTAYFAENDMMAIGAMKALQEKGYRIPEDISMVGFDDLPFCEIMTPRLTTIRVSKQEMGQLAVRRLHDLIQKKGEAKTKLQVCTQFVERDSVKDMIQG